MSAVVAAQELSYTFGLSQAVPVPVLRELNFTLEAGEIVILAGPSGSGKTTLLTLIGALRSLQSGRLRVLGQELSGATSQVQQRLRRQIGFIFQSQNLHRSLTALQNVILGLEVQQRWSRSQMTEMALAMLERVGLGDRRGHLPQQLSGGQRQRVAIARALVSQPSLILADEPTASLDGKSGRDVVELLQRLTQEQGSTILLVTHDHRILDVADRILSMEDGQLLQRESDPGTG